MKPPTPAMLVGLWRYNAGGYYVSNETHNALLRRGLIKRDRDYQAIRWTLTDEGRRVLAEHTTTGEAP